MKLGLMKYDNLLLRDYFLKYKYKIIIPSCLINSNLLSKIKELNLESVVKIEKQIPNQVENDDFYQTLILVQQLFF